MKARLIQMVINWILSDPEMIKKVFFYIADRIVERTDNDWDNEELAKLKEKLSYKDDEGL